MREKGIDISIKTFQFKHCTIISISLADAPYLLSLFQFKHCTIISATTKISARKGYSISIQALYDYKRLKQLGLIDFKSFQFKHCTIIRMMLSDHICCCIISIQALYDYKAFGSCDKKETILHFNSSIVRL